MSVGSYDHFIVWRNKVGEELLPESGSGTIWWKVELWLACILMLDPLRAGVPAGTGSREVRLLRVTGKECLGFSFLLLPNCLLLAKLKEFGTGER